MIRARVSGRSRNQSRTPRSAPHPEKILVRRSKLGGRPRIRSILTFGGRLPPFHDEPELLGRPSWEVKDVGDGAHGVLHE